MAVCILTLSEYNSHTEPLFKKVEILPLPKLIEYFKLQFMHRFVVNLSPLPFVALVKINGVGCCFLELMLYLKIFLAMSLYVLYYFASDPPPAHAAPPPPSVWRSPRALLPSNCQLWLSRLWKWSPNVWPVSSGLICLKQLTLTF